LIRIDALVRVDAKVTKVVVAAVHVDGKPLGRVAPALLEFPCSKASTSTNVEVDRCYTATDFSFDLSTCIGCDHWKANFGAWNIHVGLKLCVPRFPDTLKTTSTTGGVNKRDGIPCSCREVEPKLCSRGKQENHKGR
jgi:hypothetical protein